jgi:dTDP-4-amino-4,6-dideoxygalactose transaminase
MVSSEKIQMVDLKSQYLKIKEEVDSAISTCLLSTAFIKGPQVKEFESNLARYLEVKHVISCANGTDALQIALMALGLKPGDEVIVPAFTYVASAEVIGLLNLIPVMVDVDYTSFNVTLENIQKGLSSKTKAMIPVHLFGQSCEMDKLMDFANANGIYVVEDNAQSIGASYFHSNGQKQKAGTIGHIGCTSFFPTKNLGCFGDGGAMVTNDDKLAEMLQMISSHGQKKKYYHEVVGVNSRLDTLQAAILDVKLKYLDEYISARQNLASYYNAELKGIDGVILPETVSHSTHCYNQYTLKVRDEKRDKLKQHLESLGVPTMIYYPLPLQQQEAFKYITRAAEPLDVSARLSESVLSLPMHTEMSEGQRAHIVNAVKSFFK